MKKKIKKSSGKITSETEKKLPSKTGHKEERKNISHEISGTKTAGKEIKKKLIPERSANSEDKSQIKKSIPLQENKKIMPERTGAPLDKSQIKKSMPLQENKKIMPERTGAPLDKSQIKKSMPSGKIITYGSKDLSHPGDTHKDTGNKEKTIKKIIKKIIKSPSGEIIKKEIIDRSEIREKKTSDEEKLVKKIKGKLEEKKETPRLKDKKITPDDDLIDSLLRAEGIEDFTDSKETARLKDKKIYAIRKNNHLWQ